MDCMASSILENISSRIRCLQSRHGSDLCPEATLLVTCRVEGFVFVKEKYSMKRLLQIPASRFLPPGSGFLPQGYGFLPPGLDPASSFRLPGRVIYPALG